MDVAQNSPSVLIVDDDPNFRSLIKVLLQTSGCHLLEARSARDADLIMREYRPNLLIVDYRLPGTDGIQWIQRVREAGYNTPIIFLSGTWCDLRTFNTLRSLLKVNMILQKPIVPELFLEQIENLLPKRRSLLARIPIQEETEAQYPDPEVYEAPELDADPQYLLENAYRAMEEELPPNTEPQEEMPPLPDQTKEKLRNLFESDVSGSGTPSIMPKYLVNPPKGKEIMRKSSTSMPAVNANRQINTPNAVPPVKPATQAGRFANVEMSRDNAEEMAIINSEDPDELEQLSRFSQKASVEMALRRARADYAKDLPERVEALALAIKAYKDDRNDSGAFDEAVQLAHQLKGTAGSLGFPHLGKTAGIVEALLKSGSATDPDTAQKSWLQIERQVAQCLGIAESNAATYAGADQIPRKAIGKKVAVVGPFIGFAKLTADLAFDDTAEAYLLDEPSDLLKQGDSERFDAIIIDSAGLGDQSPTELLERIRRHPTLRNTPVSFIANQSWHSDQALWFYTGAELIIPFNANQALLRATVEEMLTLSENNKAHILTVDDDVVLTNFICDTLSTHGMTAIAENEPINVLNRLEEYPADLILLDVVMPGVSGYDVCRLLRSQEKYASIPVLFLTSKNTQQGRAAAFKAGADDFLSKPILTEELLTRVCTRLELSERYLLKAGKSSLTGMTTKQTFFDKLPALIKKAHDANKPFTVAIVGIDAFPELAVECGFKLQEQIFKDLAALLQARFRIEDIKAHWTEGSFALAFPGIDLSVAMQAVTILAGEFAISTTHSSSGKESASKRVIRYGLAEVGGDGFTADSLLSRAYDRCLKAEPVDVSSLIASINESHEQSSSANTAPTSIENAEQSDAERSDAARSNAAGIDSGRAETKWDDSEWTDSTSAEAPQTEAATLEADHVEENRVESEAFEIEREAAENAESNEFDREEQPIEDEHALSGSAPPESTSEAEDSSADGDKPSDSGLQAHEASDIAQQQHAGGEHRPAAESEETNLDNADAHDPEQAQQHVLHIEPEANGGNDGETDGAHDRAQKGEPESNAHAEPEARSEQTEQLPDEVETAESNKSSDKGAETGEGRREGRGQTENDQMKESQTNGTKESGSSLTAQPTSVRSGSESESGEKESIAAGPPQRRRRRWHEP
jgi:diguanylate cyclase (GGDEF)-like protein